MIRIYAVSYDPDSKIKAVRGLRLARARLGDGGPGTTLRAVKDAIDSLTAPGGPGRVLIGQTEDKLTAWTAIKDAQADGISVQVEGDLTPEEAFSEEPPQPEPTSDAEPDLIPEDHPEREGSGDSTETDHEYPEYAASLVAMTMLAASDGAAGNAVVLANTIRGIMQREGTEDDVVFWNDVIHTLFDAFPPNAVSLQALAAEYGFTGR